MERFRDSHLLWNEKDTSRHTKLNCTFSSFKQEIRSTLGPLGNSPQSFYQHHLQKATGANPIQTGLTCGPQDGKSKSWPPVPVKLTLSGKKIFADVSKLRTVRWDHPGLTGWTLNPITRVLVRREDTKEEKHGRKGHGKTEAGWSDAATSQGTPRNHQKLEEAGSLP